MLAPLGVLIALLPGGVLALMRARVDPEPRFLFRRLARIHGIVGVLGLLAASAAIALGTTALWVLLALGAGALVGSWPSQRRLRGDPTPLLPWLEFRLRLLIGMNGFPLALALAPAVVIDPFWDLLAFVEDDGMAWQIGGMSTTALMLGLLGWESVRRAVLPLERIDPASEPGLARVAAATTVERFDVFRIVSPNARLAQAWAIPDPRKPTVLLGDALFARFEPDERAAVFAHEVAHLEQPRDLTMRLAGSVMVLLVPTAALGVPWAVAGRPYAPWVALAWPWAVFALLVAYLGTRKGHEAAADARAEALSGDGRALAVALDKLHALNGLPRRFHHAEREGMSHPDLPERARALGDGPAMPEPLSGEGFALDETGARLGTGPRVPWEDLSDLGLEPWRRGARLFAEDDGKRRTAPIPDDRIEHVEAWLDAVADRVGTRAPPPVRLMPLVMVATALLALAGTFATVIAPFALWAAMVRRSRPAWAATGTGLVGAAVLALFGFHGPSGDGWGAVAGAAVGIVVLRRAWREPAPAPSLLLVAPIVAIGVGVAAVIVSLVGAVGEPDRLALGIALAPAVVVAPLGLAAAVFAVRGPVRWLGFGPAVVALALFQFALIPWPSRDLFVGNGHPLWRTDPVRADAVLPLGQAPWALRTSRDGRWFAVGHGGARRRKIAWTIGAVDAPGRERVVHARAVGFDGAGAVVSLFLGFDGWDLSAADPDSGTVSWTLRGLDLGSDPILVPHGAGWQVDTWVGGGRRIVRGVRDQVVETLSAPVGAGEDAFRVRDAWFRTATRGASRWPWPSLLDTAVLRAPQVMVWSQDGVERGASVTWLPCVSGDDALWCSSPARALLFRWAPGDVGPVAVARTDGPAWVDAPLPDGRVPVWHRGGLDVIDPIAHTRTPLEVDRTVCDAAAPFDGGLLVLSGCGRRTALFRFHVPAAGG